MRSSSDAGCVFKIKDNTHEGSIFDTVEDLVIQSPRLRGFKWGNIVKNPIQSKRFGEINYYLRVFFKEVENK